MMCKLITANYITHYTSSILDNKENKYKMYIIKQQKEFFSKHNVITSSENKDKYPQDIQSKCEALSGTITASMTVCVSVGEFVIHMYCVDIVSNTGEPDPAEDLM